jgi:2-polyprenyl-6-methoxyphenol hydroxylase-like FAD-dependent oxidoreductase
MAARAAAVVIGSGVAGLVAARVLAERFGRVTVLDRDELPAEPQPRPNVPQGGHPHVLLRAGLDGLDDLFSGIGAELVQRGAVTLDATGDIQVYRDMLFPKRSSGITMVSFSRPLLETVLRRRLTALSNVEIRSGRRLSSGPSGSATRRSTSSPRPGGGTWRN